LIAGLGALAGAAILQSHHDEKHGSHFVEAGAIFPLELHRCSAHYSDSTKVLLETA
jgi:hypothetical protein